MSKGWTYKYRMRPILVYAKNISIRPMLPLISFYNKKYIQTYGKSKIEFLLMRCLKTTHCWYWMVSLFDTSFYLINCFSYHTRNMHFKNRICIRICQVFNDITWQTQKIMVHGKMVCSCCNKSLINWPGPNAVHLVLG